MSDPTSPDPIRDSLLGDLAGPAPDMDEVQAFDAAVDRINRVIALFSAQIAQLRAQPSADPGQISALAARRDHYITERGSLTPEDRQRVARLRQECVEILREASARGQA